MRRPRPRIIPGGEGDGHVRVHIAAVLPVNTRPHTQLQAQLDAVRRVGRRLRLAEGEKRRAELCSPEASGGAARVDAPASVTVVGHVVVKLEENGDDRGAVAGSDGCLLVCTYK